MPAMIQTFLKTSAVALALLVIILPNASHAQSSDEHAQVLLVSLLERLQTLVELSKAREDFYTDEQSQIDVDQETSQYFFVRTTEDSDETVFGTYPATLTIETDAGVSQLLLTTDCLDSYVRINDAENCQTDSWLIAPDEEDGIKTFTVTLTAETDAETDEFKINLFACRFNGCFEETDISIKYKNEVTFVDQLEIYDRWEWAYEWDDAVFHVQEVLLNFPYQDVRKVEVRVRCDGHGLYIDVDDADDRITCNSRRRYSQPDYREYQIDDVGNTYNLRVESVTDDIQEDEVGFVEMEFTFIGYKNETLAQVYHRPVQLDALPEEDEAE